MVPTTDDGITVGAVIPLENVCGEVVSWPTAAVCSGDDPTAKVTNGPALCSAGRDGIIEAATSLEVGVPVSIASMLTPLLEKVGLRTMPATVVAGMMEASIMPASPVAEVVKLAAFPAAVMV